MLPVRPNVYRPDRISPALRLHVAVTMWYHKLLDLLFVPRCAACRALLPPGSGALCDGCRAAYEKEKELCCPVCGQVFSACRCPEEVHMRAGIRTLVKIFPYYSHDGKQVTSRMIYRLKRRPDARLAAHFAQEIADALSVLMRDEPGEYCLTYAPRSRRALHRYGFDHMRMVAEKVSERLAIPLIHAFENRARHEQKTLDRWKRFRERRRFLTLRGKPDFRRRRVILLDDITTSGATLATMAYLCHLCGARQVVAAVLGVTSQYPSPL